MKKVLSYDAREALSVLIGIVIGAFVSAIIERYYIGDPFFHIP